MPLRNIRLTIAYDGFDYSGWQIQPGKRTIQGELVEAVSNLFGKRTYVHGASRTDAGVSALGQVGLFETDSPIPTENLAKAITDKLPADIAVLDAVEEAWGFDLMSSVTNKLYRYKIYTARARPVLNIRQRPTKGKAQCEQSSAATLPRRASCVMRRAKKQYKH